MCFLSILAASREEVLAAKRISFRRCFSFPVLLGVLLFSGVFFGTQLEGTRGDAIFNEGDTWWHIHAGEEILRTHSWPRQDSYSFTASGTDWIAYEWLGETAIAGVWRLGGLVGLKLLQLLLAGALLVLLYAYCWLRCGNPKAAFAACAAILPVTSPFFTLRPQVLGYIFFLVVLVCLELHRRGRWRALWLVPPVFLFWVNTHGTFVFGLLALGLAWICGIRESRFGLLRARRWSPAERLRLGLVFLACVAVLPLTPYGTRLAAYPLDIGFLQPTNIGNIAEWFPVSTQAFLSLVILSLLLFVLISLLALRKDCELSELALLVAASILTFLHLRFAFLFFLVGAPLLAAVLAQWFPPYRPEKDHPVWNAFLILALAAGMVAGFPSAEHLEAALATHFPVAAVQYLQSHSVPGPMLNEYGWGGYMEEALGPSRKVFIDGRADIYERTGVLADYLRLTRLEPGALTVLRKYGVRSCLLRTDSPLATVLDALPGWRRIYRDRIGALYVYRPSGS